MSNQSQNVVVELPPGGIASDPPQGSHNEESITESFTMIGQSQAESCMSSYICVPSLNNNMDEPNSDGELSDEEDEDTLTQDRIVEIHQIQQDLAQTVVQQSGTLEFQISNPIHVPSATTLFQRISEEEKKKRLAKLRRDMYNRVSKQHDKLEVPPNSYQTTKSLSMIHEAYGYSIVGSALDLKNLDDADIVPLRVIGTPQSRASALAKILSRASAVSSTILLAKSLEDLKSEYMGFLLLSKKAHRPTFAGFMIAYRNQFEEIQSNGIDCERPGFHLCRTIENAMSFWHFQRKNNRSNDDEHLWIMLGTEAPPSNIPTGDAEIPRALPLACIHVKQIESSANVLNKLMVELREWAKEVPTYRPKN